ncbi:MAG: chemotaxis-specific protein-glutamate methyltransferase CheB [Pseudobutyrivibrio sp.]|nr:chemotaxis-specific protein-glutamate methyltransferase CheB [Pseudobutyrivibrio sp.]
MLKILVVDDSALMRKVICDIISTDSNFCVADVSADGLDAYNKIKNNPYDIVVLDMILPKMTGVQLMGKLNSEGIKANVILVSSSLKEDADSTVKAMEYGALDFVVKPYRTTPESREEFSKQLLGSMRSVGRAASANRPRVARSTPSSTPARTASSFSSSRQTLNSGASAFASAPSRTSSTASAAASLRQATASARNATAMVSKSTGNKGSFVKGKKIIALACSTGGPQALHTFVPMLPRTLKYPLVLVQHMPAGFTASLASRLNQISEINVKEAEEGEFFEPGCVYITPGGKHMEICENASHEAYCHLNDGPPVNSLKPCADVMYQSLADSSFEEIICVVLTGMGADGTEGIEYLSKSKSTYVISQDAATCVVYGMPKSVEQRGLSDEVKPLNEIAGAIIKKLGV